MVCSWVIELKLKCNSNLARQTDESIKSWGDGSRQEMTELHGGRELIDAGKQRLAWRQQNACVY